MPKEILLSTLIAFQKTENKEIKKVLENILKLNVDPNLYKMF
jgi:hypothetical protein